MNASDFANFFDFSIEWVENEKVDENDLFFHGTINENGTFTGYQVVDDQCVFDTRYIDEVRDLPECFDSLLVDYIDSDLEEYGYHSFPFDGYENAKDWIKENCPDLKNTHIYNVICCLVNPELIFDDVALDKDFSPLEK